MKISKLFTQIAKMELRDWKALCILMITFIPGKIYKIFNPDTWIITEYKHLAKDNGYWLFKYIRENYPDRKCFYPISYDSPDYKKVASLGNVIEFGSFKHYILFWGVSKFIGTTKYYGFPYGRICEDLVQWNFHSFKNIFLNHGVARGYSKIVDGRDTNYDLIFAMSEDEKGIMIKENYQNPNIIRCLGFCRHDNLNDSQLKNNQLLIMPTWRNWLDYRLIIDKKEIDNIKHSFLESDYYKYFISLINNSKFISFIESNNLQVIFYLHEYAQAYVEYFTSKSKNIIVAKNTDYDIQYLLKSSVMMITDYSSVVYDFAYMYKPLLYYQFDIEDFEENQYKQGTSFTYEKDGFGKVIYNENSLIDEVIRLYNNNFIMDDMYRKRVYNYFPYHDKNNCERIYNEIEKL